MLYRLLKSEFRFMRMIDNILQRQHEPYHTKPHETSILPHSIFWVRDSRPLLRLEHGT